MVASLQTREVGSEVGSHMALYVILIASAATL